jgi:hypothetical protein
MYDYLKDDMAEKECEGPDSNEPTPGAA